MREDVVFKGVNGELQLTFNERADFTAVLEQLQAKLASATGFFDHNATVKLPARLAADKKAQLTKVLAGHGLTCREPEEAEGQEKAVTGCSLPERDGYEIKALVVNKTLRSGQKVVYDGSVIVIGDVNPGAQVIAGEDIIILGACRGVAHAGANGNQAATITAAKILATQLRIAGLIARSPDELDKPAYMETAKIKNGAVVIEPANR
jgi:septum site-determining protein MinC